MLASLKRQICTRKLVDWEFPGLSIPLIYSCTNQSFCQVDDDSDAALGWLSTLKEETE